MFFIQLISVSTTQITLEIVFHNYWWDAFMHGSRFFSFQKMCFSKKKKEVLINILSKKSQLFQCYLQLHSRFLLSLMLNINIMFWVYLRWYSVRGHQELPSMSHAEGPGLAHKTQLMQSFNWTTITRASLYSISIHSLEITFSLNKWLYWKWGHKIIMFWKCNSV